MSDSTPLKRCTKCKNEFPATLEYFFRHGGKKSSKDGLAPTCKRCSKARDYPNTRRWYYNNKDRVLEEGRLKYQKDPEPAKQRAKRRLAEKYDEIIQYQREYSRKHREKINARNRANFKPTENQRANIRNRRARKRAAPGTHTATDIQRIYEEQDGRCLYCGIRVFDGYHVDHIIPLARGGSNWPHNLAVACEHCNTSKNDRLISEWERVRGW